MSQKISKLSSMAGLGWIGLTIDRFGENPSSPASGRMARTHTGQDVDNRWSVTMTSSGQLR